MSAVKSYLPYYRDEKLVAYCAEFGYCYPCYKEDSQDPIQLIEPGVCPVCSSLPRPVLKNEVVWSKDEEERVSLEFSSEAKAIPTEVLVKSLELIKVQLSDYEYEPLRPQIMYWQRLLIDELVLRRAVSDSVSED